MRTPISAAVLLVVQFVPPMASAATPPTEVDLSNYIRIGRYDLPEPTRTTAPPGNLLCQEASAVTYNWDTDTLFITGDGGRSITQVSKTGQLVDTMTLAAGSSPQGTDFYDPEGLTYIGNGEFVMSEERDRQLVKFTYAAGTTLSRALTKTVKIGTFVDNTGTEGLSWDPQTGGFICLKEISPMGIFQTNVDFDAGTATNGSPTTVNSVDLFDPALMGFTDVADVFALSNLPSIDGLPQSGNLIVLSQENARIINIDRSGNIASSLQIVSDPGNPLTAANQQHEGVTMDRDGNLYVVNENGGGDIDHPQLWVYAPSLVPNAAPTAVAIQNGITSIAENTNTVNRVKIGDIVVTDDGLGTNVLAVGGADAAFFEIVDGSLYLKAGTVLDYESKTEYAITVTVDDASLGNTPDASVGFTLQVTDVVNETLVPTLIISEVSPWSSGESSFGADWFEVTNTGADPVDITGFRVDDGSNDFGASLPLLGVSVIAPGESVIFIEATPANAAMVTGGFKQSWFGSNVPAGLQVGTYSGSGIGLSTGGDAVNLFNASGEKQAGVTFGAAPAGPVFATFENGAGLDGTAVSKLSRPGVFGAFVAAGASDEIGSPGTTGELFISEVAPWGSGSTPYAADWFEVTNAGARTIDLTGWRMDDNSNAFASGLPLNGVSSIAPGESVIFIETATAGDLPAKAATFLSTWFGASLPAGLQIGSYSGGGAGLSTGGDAVNLFNAAGNRVTGVAFGASAASPFASFENHGRLGSRELPLPVISTLSEAPRNGAFVAAQDATEIGSPGTTGGVRVTEIAPWSSGSSPVGADWFEVTNFGATAVDLTGWKMDDISESPVGAAPMTGVGILAPGESAVFIETAAPESKVPAFLTNWFGANPPADLQIGSYTGGGVGLGTGGDAVNLFSATNVKQAGVSFGASPGGPFATFENSAGLNSTGIAALSIAGARGAFVAVNSASETGSPGAIDGPAPAAGTFAAWLVANGYFSTGFGGDIDGDGIGDGVEYFFNEDPNSGERAGHLPLLVTETGGDFEFRFRRLAGLTGAEGVIEISSDLENWTEGAEGLDYSVLSELTDGGDVEVSYLLPGTGPSSAGVSADHLVPNLTATKGGALGGVHVTNHGLVGVGRLTGEALDKFGETMGAASGLFITDWAYDGGSGEFSGTFQVLPDRGYNSGTIFSNYAARIHEVGFTFKPYYGAGPVAQGQVQPVYVDSTKFTYQDGAVTKFTTGLNATATATVLGQTLGVTTAANGPGGSQESLISFDAEAVHLFPDGSGFVSDEYGTYIARFDAAKKITGITQLPDAAKPFRPAGTPNFDSVTAPTSGRRNNQGLEGMSVSPDATRLFALMQSALVQDTNGSQQQTRNNTRLFVYDIEGANVEAPVLVGEYVVKLPRFDSNGDGSGLDRTAAQSEIVAISNGQFLMLPRDGNGLGVGSATPTVFKSVQLVDFSSATNILGLHDAAGEAVSPAGVPGSGIKAAASVDVINLLNPEDHAKFGINTNNAAPDPFTLNEKIEGMSLVPDLSTPRPDDWFLFVANDNDFQSSDVLMLDGSGTVVSYGDGRADAGNGPVTNDATYYVYRLTIDAGRRFYRMRVGN